jgi:hypothetical protein
LAAQRLWYNAEEETAMTLTLLAAFLCQPPKEIAPEARKQPILVPLGASLRLDKTNGFVVIDAEVALKEGLLEMFLCPRRSKEHESVMVADVKPRDVHFALLLAGAVPGRPVQFDPPKPPSGQRIKVWIEREVEGRKTVVDAREWIRDDQAKQPMSADFVFVGSQFVRAPGSDKSIYVGDDGYLICVANFPGAVIDVARHSTAADAEQKLYVPFTERIPDRGAKVRLVLEPVVD